MLSNAARIALFLLLCVWMLAAAEAEPISVNEFTVTDGDTIHLFRLEKGTRLVGFNAPETASHPGVCVHELTAGPLATAYFEQLITPPASLDLIFVDCSCSPTTLGTDRCNFGRSCAILFVDGKDVADLMIAGGHAVAFDCGPTRCPKLPHPWCD